ncbi:MAG: hypothetical protein ERJ68_09400 [Aphanocapsa feldmannii 277cI]|uniref:3'-phosphate/5'-hydroxy nucleic acid ligase n=1 Tax=Aphanocapsa feldmannii 277cI TaxID=2507554 RepID=A0A524RRE8_9CHRO|nr:MAG: hypothetical protein ERJ68_09400 [Aphanocapsa feldmannii 277cI]
MPFVQRHVAVMPDVHWRLGATVGSVIPTKGAIVPAAVGVDIPAHSGTIPPASSAPASSPKTPTSEEAHS